MNSKIYLTTPLYYVNSVPHVGHAYTTILADVLTRYQKRFGNDAYFLTGLDEHGQKVADAAKKRNVDPQFHCDEMCEVWKGIWKETQIDYNDFIRTTEPRHQKVVCEILNLLNEKGDIYQEEYEGWYSVFEERFFTEKDLVNGLDPVGGREVERLQEKNYFFRMSKYQDWLIDHYTQNPDAVKPRFRLNEVLGFLKKPLSDLCISRPKSRLSWGIPIPWDDDYVTYVWFDALLNYYSATVSPPPGEVVQWPADIHLLAKDILTTHAVYWPIMLHAAGISPPKQLFAHGYWLAKDDVKMSKSIGNVVSPSKLIEILGSDSFRYVLMREMVVGQDASFSLESFISRVNTDLANDLGNLFSRLAKIWETAGYPATQPFPDIPDGIPEELVKTRSQLSQIVQVEIEAFRPHSAIQEMMKLVRGLNKLVETLKPWEIIKTAPDSIHRELTWALDALKDTAENLIPIMPTKMRELLLRIGENNSTGAYLIKPKVGKPLFPRLKYKTDRADKKENEPKNQKLKRNSLSEKKSEISFEEFSKIDLRIGKVLSAKKHEDADKLLVLRIDIGTDIKQIVAGIARAYDPEELIGKSVIVVSNLKPVQLRGVSSEGMLIATGDNKALSLVVPEKDTPPGSKVR